MVMVAQKWYLVWMGLWDLINALQKYDLGLLMRWFYYAMTIYMLNALMTCPFRLKFMMISKLGKVHAFQLKCHF